MTSVCEDNIVSKTGKDNTDHIQNELERFFMWLTKKSPKYANRLVHDDNSLLMTLLSDKWEFDCVQDLKENTNKEWDILGVSVKLRRILIKDADEFMAMQRAVKKPMSSIRNRQEVPVSSADVSTASDDGILNDSQEEDPKALSRNDTCESPVRTSPKRLSPYDLANSPSAGDFETNTLHSLLPGKGWHDFVVNIVREKGHYDFDYLGAKYKIKQSSIAGAGLGLFANETMEAGKLLALKWDNYGEVKEILFGENEVEHDNHVQTICNTHPHTNYLMNSSPPKRNGQKYYSILADPFNFPLGFANDPRNTSSVNHAVHFDGTVITTKAIKQGDELYVDYGPEYPWESISDDHLADKLAQLGIAQKKEKSPKKMLQQAARKIGISPTKSDDLLPKGFNSNRAQLFAAIVAKLQETDGGKDPVENVTTKSFCEKFGTKDSSPVKNMNQVKEHFKAWFDECIDKHFEKDRHCIGKSCAWQHYQSWCDAKELPKSYRLSDRCNIACKKSKCPVDTCKRFLVHMCQALGHVYYVKKGKLFFRETRKNSCGNYYFRAHIKVSKRRKAKVRGPLIVEAIYRK